MRSPLSLFCLLVTLSMSIRGALAAEPNTLSDAEQQAGFQLLFNGHDLSGWKNGGNWVVQDSSIARTKRGGSLVYQQQKVPDDFELRFQWKVATGSNSGIYYRPGQYEYQILDNAVHADGKNPRTSAASLYFCMAPSRDATRPIGQWNTGRVVCQGSVVQHWLNGEKVISFDYADPKWKWHVELLRQRGGDLSARGAYLSLQDHGDPVWYRNLRMRKRQPDERLDLSPVTPAIISAEVLKAEQTKLAGIVRRRQQRQQRNNPPDEKPNFLFIIADDCTHRDLGCYGGQALTPNIDRLASEGMRFTQCFQAAPMCSPTRHNLYTGLYPVKSGAYPNHTFAKEGTRSIAHYLKPLGYRVALSGKRHINPPEVFPFEYSAVKNNPDLEAIDQLMGECQETKTPFCLFACSNEPHSPWNKGDASQYDASSIKLPPYFVDTEQTRRDMVNYLAEITYYDWQVGECLKLLDKHQLADNTLVLVVSEQGSSFPFGKWTCYDTGLQSACIARWPGKVKANSVSDAMIEYVDVLPTFVAAAGGTPDPQLDGTSLLRVLKGDTTEHKQHVFGIMTTRGINNGSDYYGIRSVRSQRFKYIRNLTPEATFRNACVNSRTFKSWKALAATGDADAAEKVRRYQHRPAEELYDVTRDRTEWHNLADDPSFASVKAELSRKLDEWMQSQGDLGQETELAAREHQNRARNRRKK